MRQCSVDIQVGDYQLNHLTRISVLMGKNGCGKSTLLKNVEQGLQSEDIGRKRYVTPERGGVLVYEPNVDNNMSSNARWLEQSRRVNQFNQFREQSMAQFRKLEVGTFRASEAAGQVAAFQPIVDRMNALLDNVEVRRDEMTFKVYSKLTGEPVDSRSISSGESELISLAIEILTFGSDCIPDKDNVLFVDEPDVHLHPDLQARFVAFLTSAAEEYSFTVLLATHSTAMLGGLAAYDGASVAFMRAGQKALVFEPIGEVHRRVLPVFGAHPLSNVFNQTPVLLLEGDDDVRIWQQAVRSSLGNVRVFPVSCDTVSALAEHEKWVSEIIASIYDNARAYSLRDGDGIADQLDDMPPVVRIRLGCRAAENLLLTDEVLHSVGLDWERVKELISKWIETNPTHPRFAQMSAFRTGGFDRRQADLKSIRMVLAGVILSTSKPWEVLVGRALGEFVRPAAGTVPGPGSLHEFLGHKAVTHLCRET